MMTRIQTYMTETEARNVLRREYGDSSPETVWRAYAADTVRTQEIRLAALGLMGEAELLPVLLDGNAAETGEMHPATARMVRYLNFFTA